MVVRVRQINTALLLGCDAYSSNTVLRWTGSRRKVLASWRSLKKCFSLAPEDRERSVFVSQSSAYRKKSDYVNLGRFL